MITRLEPNQIKYRKVKQMPYRTETGTGVLRQYPFSVFRKRAPLSHVNLGAGPSREPLALVEDSHYRRIAEYECVAFILEHRHTLGYEPGASLMLTHVDGLVEVWYVFDHQDAEEVMYARRAQRLDIQHWSIVGSTYIADHETKADLAARNLGIHTGEYEEGMGH